MLKEIGAPLADASPDRFVQVGGTSFFTADDSVHGRELWKSDGTADGTVLVKDLFPGPNGQEFRLLANANGTLFFTGGGQFPEGLWKSDGTSEGTVFLGNVHLRSERTANVGGTLFFSGAADGTYSYELWKSDGTVEGTVLVADLSPGASLPSTPDYLTEANGAVFFVATRGDTGRELWKSDGTLGGTVLVKDVRAGTASGMSGGSSSTSLANVGGTLFFSANDGTTGTELWKTDGTAAGTVLVKDIKPGAVDSEISWFANVNGTLFFRANDGTTGQELWKSDGTAEGTVLVREIRPGTSTAALYNLTNVGGTLFFVANDGTTGFELWKSNGTAEGTMLVKDISPGGGDQFSHISRLTNVSGTLFFWANDLVHGYELWKSDGTAEGTLLVADRMPGAASSSQVSFGNANGTLLFSGNDGTRGYELWKSDGTPEGTVLLKDINPHSPGAWISNITNVGGTGFFVADDSVHGEEVWKTDGTAAGTVMVKDINPNISGSYGFNPDYLTNVSGTLFFFANDGATGRSLWKSDGTAEGTVLVKDVRPGGPSSNGAYYQMTNVNGKLFFVGNDGTTGRELWTSDGTAAGTVLVKDIRPGVYITRISWMTNVGGTLFFSANDGTKGAELWKSDGTAAGTTLVKDICPGTTGSTISSLTNFNGTLLFTANDGTTGQELWRSDGTTAGTVRVKDIQPGTASALFTSQTLQIFGGELFFTANDGTHGPELWKSDGTSSGTVLFTEVGASKPLAVVDDTLFFSANDGTHGFELWKTQGTPASTVLVKDMRPGSGSSFPATYSGAENVNGILFFTADNGTTGRELWESDGTSEGTHLVADVVPGSSSFSVRYLTNVNGTLMFAGDDLISGSQVWVVRPSPVIDLNGPASGNDLNVDWTGVAVSVAAGTATIDSDSLLALLTAALVDPRPGDVLAADTTGTDIAASFDGGALILSGVDSVANYEQVLRSITYHNANGGPGLLTQTVRFTATDSSGGEGRIARATIDINSISVAGPTAEAEGNDGTTPLIFTVTLAAVPSQAVTVDYTTVDGSATSADGDFTPQSGTLTFAPGETRREITIAVNGDTFDEADETFGITLNNAINASITSAEASATILADDPLLSITTASAPEGNSGTSSLIFTLLMRSPSSRPIVLNYATNSGTATSGTDFVDTSGAVTFAPWQTEAAITVSILGDTTVEPDETFAINLSGATDAELEGTIVDDDGRTTVAGVRLFYKNSTKWNVTDGATFSDDNAIAPDKTAYLPGSGTATFAAVSSYDKGINGVMVDLSGPHGTITANDFTFKRGNNNSPNAWVAATAPTTVTTRAAAGQDGDDRIELLWDNNQSVKKQWLQVIVGGNDTLGGFNTNTGLTNSYVFYFGSAIGDSGAGDSGAFSVTSTDEINARNNPKTFTATRSNVNDFNRDGSVNSSDQIIARNNTTNLGNQLKFLVVGAGGPFAPQSQDDVNSIDSGADDAGIASALASASSRNSADVVSSSVTPPPTNSSADSGARTSAHQSAHAVVILGESQGLERPDELDDSLLNDLLSLS
jgi:ELWxxDGT repeat protein